MTWLYLGCKKMRYMRSMHKLTHDSHRVTSIWESHHEVMESSNKLTKLHWGSE